MISTARSQYMFSHYWTLMELYPPQNGPTADRYFTLLESDFWPLVTTGAAALAEYIDSEDVDDSY